MFGKRVFNRHSEYLIDNIWVNAKQHPMYASFEIQKDSESYADAGAVAIKILKSNQPINMFLFYPSCDGSGRVGSCAIYGTHLDGHKAAIERSMQIFGLPVESIVVDEGLEKFLDISIKKY